MVKYLIGLGALVIVAAGYFILVPETTVSQDEVPVSADEEVSLEDMAASARESIPTAVTDTLTLTDALFLPRLQIMEYTYVTTVADARSTARDMRTMIEGRADAICLEGRQMFEMGATQRYSFEDGQGNIFQRVYILPEDCQRLY